MQQFVNNPTQHKNLMYICDTSTGCTDMLRMYIGCHAVWELHLLEGLTCSYIISVVVSLRQSKLLKRRADMIKELRNELNPIFYEHICQELQYELGKIYKSMVELKEKILKERVQMGNLDEEAQRKAQKKINFLISEAIQAFQGFLDLIKGTL